MALEKDYPVFVVDSSNRAGVEAAVNETVQFREIDLSDLSDEDLTSIIHNFRGTDCALEILDRAISSNGHLAMVDETSPQEDDQKTATK